MKDFKIEDYKSLPDHIDFDNEHDEKESWSFGRGGYGTADELWHISKTEDHPECGLFNTIYVLPKFFSYMMRLQRNWGKDEIRNSIKSTLNI
jgi:hypothetical protein